MNSHNSAFTARGAIARAIGFIPAAFIVVLLTLAMLAASGCKKVDGEEGSAQTAKSSAPAAKTKPAAKASPSAIQASGREAVQILESAFSLADRSDFKAVQGELKKLKEIQPSFDSADKAKRDRMLKGAQSADEGARSGDRHATLKGVNDALFAASELAYVGDPEMPNDLFRLMFYSRELKVWGAAGDEAKIKAAALNIKESWQSVKTELTAKGDEGRDLARKFEPLTMALEMANTPVQAEGLAKPLLEQADAMRRLFKRTG